MWTCGVARRGVRGQPVPAVLRELVLQRLARLLFINLDTDAPKVTVSYKYYVSLCWSWRSEGSRADGVMLRRSAVRRRLALHQLWHGCSEGNSVECHINIMRVCFSHIRERAPGLQCYVNMCYSWWKAGAWCTIMRLLFINHDITFQEDISVIQIIVETVFQIGKWES